MRRPRLLLECGPGVGMADEAGFQLFESILWEPDGGFFLLDYHLQRMKQGAAYFDFPHDERALIGALKDLAERLDPQPYKLRLYLACGGRVNTDAKTLGQDFIPDPLHIGLSRHPIRSDDPFVLHKTTNRRAYDGAKASRPDCEDVLLWNERGELTETTRANLVARVDGALLTPPVRSGLLAGTFRQWLLDRGEIRERVIRVDELETVDELFLISSIRRWYRTALVSLPGEAEENAD